MISYLMPYSSFKFWLHNLPAFVHSLVSSSTFTFVIFQGICEYILLYKSVVGAYLDKLKFGPKPYTKWVQQLFLNISFWRTFVDNLFCQSILQLLRLRRKLNKLPVFKDFKERASILKMWFIMIDSMKKSHPKCWKSTRIIIREGSEMSSWGNFKMGIIDQ